MTKKYKIPGLKPLTHKPNIGDMLIQNLPWTNKQGVYMVISEPKFIKFYDRYHNIGAYGWTFDLWNLSDNEKTYYAPEGLENGDLTCKDWYILPTDNSLSEDK